MPARKGVDALQLVFAMFILIVVTLVMIKLFTGIVKPGSLPDINDFKESYNYDKERNNCANICGTYAASSCEDLAAAVTFCQKKVSVDIDGTFKTGEKGHYGIVNKIPYCEDGLYCFHILPDCGCGSYSLDATTCKDVMMDYYINTIGFSDETTASVICKSILPGLCKKDPRDWTEKRAIGYDPQLAKGSDAKYGVGDPAVIGADYWWKKAGYSDVCGAISGTTTTTVSGGLQLTCTSPSAGAIQCSWSGCSGNTLVNVGVSGSAPCEGGLGQCNPTGDRRPSGSCVCSNVAAGTYGIYLDCDGQTPLLGSATVS